MVIEYKKLWSLETSTYKLYLNTAKYWFKITLTFALTLDVSIYKP